MSTSDKGSRAGKDGVAEQLGEDAAEWREMRLGIAESFVSQGQGCDLLRAWRIHWSVYTAAHARLCSF